MQNESEGTRGRENAKISAVLGGEKKRERQRASASL